MLGRLIGYVLYAGLYPLSYMAMYYIYQNAQALQDAIPILVPFLITLIRILVPLTIALTQLPHFSSGKVPIYFIPKFVILESWHDHQVQLERCPATTGSTLPLAHSCLSAAANSAGDCTHVLALNVQCERTAIRPPERPYTQGCRHGACCMPPDLHRQSVLATGVDGLGFPCGYGLVLNI